MTLSPLHLYLVCGESIHLIGSMTLSPLHLYLVCGESIHLIGSMTLSPLHLYLVCGESIHLIGSMTLSSLHLYLVCGECTGAVVLWQPSHHPRGCCTLVVVEERPPPHMIVKRFGCIAIHNNALYNCFIHSFIHLIIGPLKFVQSTECTVSRPPSIIATKDMHNLDFCHYFIGSRLWIWDMKWLGREGRNRNRIRTVKSVKTCKT